MIVALIRVPVHSLRRAYKSLGSFEFAWVHSGAPVSFMFVWFHLGDPRCVLYYSSSRGLTPARLGVVGFMRVGVGSLGRT